MSTLAALAIAAGGLISIPEDAQALCPAMRVRLYAECMDQRTLFVEALVRARAEEKVLLVNFGAEWCIWCHLLDAELHGEVSASATEAEQAVAAELAAFAAEHFVVVHIEGQEAEGGVDVLEATGAMTAFANAIPFVFTVDAQGRFLEALYPERAEMEDAQGRPAHDRAVLLEMLQELVPPPAVERTGLNDG